MENIAVMVSGGGSNLQAVIDGIESGQIKAKICVVISSRKEVYAIERAKAKGIPVEVISAGNYATQEEFDDANLEALRKYKAEGIILGGYVSILGGKIIKEYKNRIINIHPALIPSFCGKGFYGIHVHEAALEYGVKVTGATVHFVDKGMDTGPIILQEAIDVLPDDTPYSLQTRVMAVEHRILKKAAALFTEGRLEVRGRIVNIIN